MTVTCSFTSAGFDAVAWSGEARSSLIDEINDPHCLFQAACWIVGQLSYGTDDDVGDVMGFLLAGGGPDTVGDAKVEVLGVIQKLLEASR